MASYGGGRPTATRGAAREAAGVRAAGAATALPSTSGMAPLTGSLPSLLATPSVGIPAALPTTARSPYRAVKSGAASRIYGASPARALAAPAGDTSLLAEAALRSVAAADARGKTAGGGGGGGGHALDATVSIRPLVGLHAAGGGGQHRRSPASPSPPSDVFSAPVRAGGAGASPNRVLLEPIMAVTDWRDSSASLSTEETAAGDDAGGAGDDAAAELRAAEVATAVDALRARLLGGAGAQADAAAPPAYDARTRLRACADALADVGALAGLQASRVFAPVLSLLEAVADEVRVAADSASFSPGRAGAAGGAARRVRSGGSGGSEVDDDALGSTLASLALSATLGSTMSFSFAGGGRGGAGSAGGSGRATPGILPHPGRSRGPTPPPGGASASSGGAGILHHGVTPKPTLFVDLGVTASTIRTAVDVPDDDAGSGTGAVSTPRRADGDGGGGDDDGGGGDAGAAAEDDDMDGFTEYAEGGALGDAGGAGAGIVVESVVLAGSSVGGTAALVEGGDAGARAALSPAAASVPRLVLSPGGADGPDGGHARAASASFHDEFLAAAEGMSDTWRAEMGDMPTAQAGV
jgi:hypothetical protein